MARPEPEMNEDPARRTSPGGGVVPELLDPAHDKAARRRRRWRLLGAALSLALIGLSAIVIHA